MLAGQVIFTAVMFYLVYQQNIFADTYRTRKNYYRQSPLLFAAAAIFFGNSLFKKKLVLINEESRSDAKQNLHKYRSAMFMQWGLMEAACLVCGICLLLTR